MERVSDKWWKLWGLHLPTIARVTFVNEGVIPIGTWMEGRRLCVDVDPKDTPYVTLSLHLDGLLWTDDAEFKAGLSSKGFNNFFVI